jgi:hypothetical protein
MSQTGLIDAVTESAHIPKGRLKNTPTPATKNPGTIHPLSDNLTILHKTHGQTDPLPFTNAHVFSKEPMTLHEKAVKLIIYYLQFTRDKPLIMKPNKNLSLDDYCYSDFAGVWHQEFAHLRDSCLSRTGFIIVLAGVPIHWSSKLQTEIALNSTEAEYIAISQCCRALLPMRRTLKDI